MHNISLNFLIKISTFTGFMVAGAGFGIRQYIKTKLKEPEYYTESLKILRSHKGICHFMGEPIIEGTLNIDDRNNNYCTLKEAKFGVPLKGSKKQGTLYLYATRDFESWNVQRLELEVEGIIGKRILVFDASTNDSGINSGK